MPAKTNSCGSPFPIRSSASGGSFRLCGRSDLLALWRHVPSTMSPMAKQTTFALALRGYSQEPHKAAERFCGCASRRAGRRLARLRRVPRSVRTRDPLALGRSANIPHEVRCDQILLRAPIASPDRDSRADGWRRRGCRARPARRAPRADQPWKTELPGLPATARAVAGERPLTPSASLCGGPRPGAAPRTCRSVPERESGSRMDRCRLRCCPLSIRSMKLACSITRRLQAHRGMVAERRTRVRATAPVAAGPCATVLSDDEFQAGNDVVEAGAGRQRRDRERGELLFRHDQVVPFLGAIWAQRGHDTLEHARTPPNEKVQ